MINLKYTDKLSFLLHITKDITYASHLSAVRINESSEKFWHS